jgi:microcin C transport system ATP-binding protein
MAVLLITHDLNLVRRFADRVAVMEQAVWWSRALWRSVCSAAAPLHPQAAGQPPPARCGGVRRRRPQPRAADPGPARGLCHAAARHPGWFRQGEFVAVQGASLRCARPTLGVVGESGSGKSTLAQAMPVAAAGELQVGGSLAAAGHPQQPPTSGCAARCRWCSRTRSRRCRRA